MNATGRLMLFGALLCAAGAAAGDAAVGEEGGAYGGDTTGNTGIMTFSTADKDGNGAISPAEARAAGIERFDQADVNGDGTLERSEFARLEGARMTGRPAPGK